MNIKLNKITWYSKLAAIIFFIGILPIVTFYLGKEYGEIIAGENVPTFISAEVQSGK